jgi:hypothetical protein
MAIKFCKIFEVEEHQVLYRVSKNEESEEEIIIITTVVEDMEMSAKISGFEENNTTADIQFEKMNQDTAESFFNTMLNLIK